MLSVSFLDTVMSIRAIGVGTPLAIGCVFLMMSLLMSHVPSTHTPPHGLLGGGHIISLVS
jgi:hypothetical protein